MVTILIIMLIITNEQNSRAAHFTYSTLSLVKPRNVLSLSSSSKLF